MYRRYGKQYRSTGAKTREGIIIIFYPFSRVEYFLEKLIYFLEIINCYLNFCIVCSTKII